MNHSRNIVLHEKTTWCALPHVQKDTNKTFRNLKTISCSFMREVSIFPTKLVTKVEMKLNTVLQVSFR